MNNYESLRRSFEDGAKKKGYELEMDDSGRYIDNWLQEGWDLFKLGIAEVNREASVIKFKSAIDEALNAGVSPETLRALTKLRFVR